MTPEEQFRRLVQLLQRTLRRAGLTQKEVSLALGHNEQYLSQALNGKARLKEETVYAVLEAARVSPEAFYRELMGGPPAPLGEEMPPEAAVPADPGEVRGVIRDYLAGWRRRQKRMRGANEGQKAAVAREAERAPAAARARRLAGVRHSQRVRELLRVKVRQADLSHRQASERLGWRSDYLSQILRGNVALKSEQVLQVLGLVGISPAAFYGELYRKHLPEDAEERQIEFEAPLFAGLTWPELLAMLDEEIDASLQRQLRKEEEQRKRREQRKRAAARKKKKQEEEKRRREEAEKGEKEAGKGEGESEEASAQGKGAGAGEQSADRSGDAEASEPGGAAVPEEKAQEGQAKGGKKRKEVPPP